MLAAQSKYLKHFLGDEREPRQGDANGRLASPLRSPLNRQFKNGTGRFDLAIKARRGQPEHK